MLIHPTDEVLLTPFRTQNVPPPMSSYQLKTSTSTSSLDISSSQTPVHISLAPSSDHLAALWQNGRVSVWSLNTRIGSGKGKAMDPTLIWTTGLLGEKFWRQVSVPDLTKREKRTVSVVLLGSEGGSDHVMIYDIPVDDATNDKTERGECFLVKMPRANGRLTASYNDLLPVWQGLDGELYEGRITPELVYLISDIAASESRTRHCFATMCLPRVLLLGEMLCGRGRPSVRGPFVFRQITLRHRWVTADTHAPCEQR